MHFAHAHAHTHKEIELKINWEKMFEYCMCLCYPCFARLKRRAFALFVYDDNDNAIDTWHKNGWKKYTLCASKTLWMSSLLLFNFLSFFLLAFPCMCSICRFGAYRIREISQQHIIKENKRVKRINERTLFNVSISTMIHLLKPNRIQFVYRWRWNKGGGLYFLSSCGSFLRWHWYLARNM